MQGSFRHFVEPTRSPGDNDTQYVIELPNTGADYVDLKNIELYVKGTLKRADGTACVDREAVALTNNSLHSLFESVTVLIGHNQQEVQMSNYPYKAFLRQLMQAQTESPACRGHGFVDERRGTSAGISDFEIAVRRFFWTLNSKKAEFMAPTYIDVFQTEGYLLPATPMRLTFKRSPASFYTITSDENKEVGYKFFIEKIGLFVPTVKVAAYMTPLLEIQTDEVPARYHFDSIDARQYAIPKDTRTRTFSRVFQGKLPTRIAVAFYRQDAFIGQAERAALLTNLFDLQRIQLLVNGLVIREHTLNVSDETYLEPFRRMTDWFSWTEVDSRGGPAHFADGSGFFTFDLMENCPMSDCGEESLLTGFADIKIQLGTAVPTDAVMMVYAMSPDSLDITKDRAVRYNRAIL